MKLNSFILVALLLASFSCNRNRVDKLNSASTEETIFVDPSSVSTERIKYSTLFDSINYVFIPTDSNFLIGKVDKLLVTDDYFFVMDHKISRTVFGIDKKGNKIFHLNKTGRGPGEYGLMTDISFVPEKQEVLVYCKVKSQVLHYDLDGKFLRAEKVPFKIRKFQPVCNKYVFHCEYYENKKLYKNGLSPNIFLFDPEKSVSPDGAAYFTPPVSQSIVLNTNSHFSCWGDTVSIKPDHSNIVYHVTADKIIPKYTLDFGSHNVDDRYWNMVRRNGIKYEELDEFLTNAGLCESFWFLESGDYIYFSYEQKNKRNDVLYSKKTKKTKHIRFYQNDMDKITLFYPKAIYKDKLYCLLKAEEVYNMEKVDTKELPGELLNQVDEFSNPIIAVFTLKPF